MKAKNLGVWAQGLSCPIIREGDDLASIVVDSVLEAIETEDHRYEIAEKSVVGITESVVARSQGNYATVDDIARDVLAKCGENATICILNPIYSRNRFAVMLRGIARAAKKIILVMPEVDEVGNVVRRHPFTFMNYDDYYRGICESEGAETAVFNHLHNVEFGSFDNIAYIFCALHNYEELKAANEGLKVFTLADILADKCEYGLLGANKSDEERVKLFPNKEKSMVLVEKIRAALKAKTGKDIIVAVYGDGCFKDPKGGIWEFADPVSMPAYTHPEILEGTPNELKVKALADGKYANLRGSELDAAIEKEISEKNNNLKGSMQSQGTTPRLYRDLLASLMDLVSGSGDRCTPIVLIQNYFK